MIRIRNLLFQPLTLTLAGSARSVHLPSRGNAEIKDSDVSAEMKKAEAKGYIELKAAKRTEPAPAPKKKSEGGDSK